MNSTINRSARFPLPVQKLFLGLALALGLVSSGWLPAQAGDHKEKPVKVKNFGQINEYYFRGGQPKENEFSDLKRLGIKTVIDLQEDGDPKERQWVEAAGMQYVNLKLSSRRAATDQEAFQFLQIVNTPENLPVYVHCAGGRHRTGQMTALYRMTRDNWSAEQAYDEMKKFDWYSFGGHKPLKTYVFDFYSRYQSGALKLPESLPILRANGTTTAVPAK